MLLTIYYLIIQILLYYLIILSYYSQMFFKIGALKNFTNFTRKHLKLKKRLQRRCFPVKFCKVLRTPFFTEHLRWLVLEGVCEGTSLLKILRSCHFNIFGIKDASERCPLWKIMNKHNCWNVYRFSCLFSKRSNLIHEYQHRPTRVNTNQHE